MSAEFERRAGPPCPEPIADTDASQFVRLLLFSRVFSESFDIREERARVWYLMTTLMAAQQEPNGVLDYGRLIEMPEVHEFVGWAGHVYRDWKTAVESFDGNFRSGLRHLEIERSKSRIVSINFGDAFHGKINAYLEMAIGRNLIPSPDIALSNLDKTLRFQIFRRLFQFQRFVYYLPWNQFMDDASCTIASISNNGPVSTYQRIDRFSDFNKRVREVKLFLMSKYLVWATILIFASEASHGRFDGLGEPALVAKFNDELFYGRISEISNTLSEMTERHVLSESHHGISGSMYRIQPEIAEHLKKFAAGVAYSGRELDVYMASVYTDLGISNRR